MRPAAPGTPIVDARQVTPSWLTAVLRQAGALDEQRVLAIERAWIGSPSAILVRLTPRYSAPVAADAPGRLFLKLVSPRPVESELLTAYHRDTGAREVAFSREVVPRLEAAGIAVTVRCWHADAAANGAAHLLLTDASITHEQVPWPVAPNEREVTAAVEALARVHGHFWEHDDLQRLAGPPSALGVPTGDSAIEALTAEMAIGGRRFLSALDGRLPNRVAEIYDEFIGSCREPMVAVWDRVRTGSGVTILHGDAHWGNFLHPREPHGGVRIIDWADWRVGIATDDLANLLGAQLDPELRRRYEPGALRRYHAVLAGSVPGYDWGRFTADYRASMRRALMTPILHGSGGLGPDSWWPQLLRIADACAEPTE